MDEEVASHEWLGEEARESWAMTCNSCGRVGGTFSRTGKPITLQEGRERMHKAGWLTHQLPWGEWNIVCPDCDHCGTHDGNY